MRDCDFQRNENGLFQCIRKGCGWVYPIKADKPPRCNCPAAPLQDKKTSGERLEQELRMIVESSRSFRPWTEVETNLAVCRGACEHFQGTSCTLTGHTLCERRRHWFRRLLTYGCTGVP